MLVYVILCSIYVSEHTDRVRNRVTLLEETVNMSSGPYSH